MFARSAWDPAAEFVTSRQWISPPPSFALSAFSRCPELRLLIDENISFKRGVGPCRERRIPMISVREAGLAGKVDEVVFDYAVEHKTCIVTMDRDFTGYGRFDHNRSYGVVHLPVPDGKRWRKKAVAAALSHFADNIAQEMIKRKGVLIRYNTSGEFRIHVPDRAHPGKSIITDIGRYPLPPHPTKDAKTKEAAGRLVS